MIHYLFFLCWFGGPVLVGPGPGLDQYGKSHDMEHLPRGITVLDFAASWCTPCWNALPRLQALADRNPGLHILVASQDREARGRDRLVRSLDLTIPVIWDGDHRWAERFQPKGMPATFVLDAEGRILFQTMGDSQKSWERLIRYVEDLLERGP